MTTTETTNGTETEMGPGASGPGVTGVTGPRGPLTKDEQAVLWSALDEAQEMLSMAKSEVKAQEAAVSNACTAIVTAMGQTGFLRKGQRIKFAKRKNSELYFVREQREELEAVDV